MAAGVGVVLAVAILLLALFLDPIAGAARSAGTAATDVARSSVARLTTRRWLRTPRGLARLRAQALAAPRRAATRVADRLVGPPAPAAVEQTQREQGAPQPEAAITDQELEAVLAERQLARERDDGSRRRVFRPASTLHLEDIVSRYFSRRGSAPIEAFVRHLEEQFGPGHGVTMLESLRSRGVVSVRRDPRAPTQMTVALSSDPGAGEAVP